MSDCDSCGHEHEPREPAPLTLYMSNVLPESSSQVVEDIMNMTILELFTRTPKGEFPGILGEITDQFADMLDEDNHPRALDVAFKVRDGNAQYHDLLDSEDEGKAELDDILSQHGVLDDEEVYGNYL